MTTWRHFIGESHYPHDYRFILEARRNGISRNVPPNVARGFNYGDRVQLLRWKQGGKLVYAFAEMVVSSVVLPHRLAEKVFAALADKAEISYSPDSLHISRDCGSYDIGGCWTVSSNVSLPEIVKTAQEIAGDEKFQVMIGGFLSDVYDKPIRIETGVKFTRGFQKGEFLTGKPVDVVPQVLGIKNYRRK